LRVGFPGDKLFVRNVSQIDFSSETDQDGIQRRQNLSNFSRWREIG